MQEYGPNPTLRTYELSVSLPSPAYRRYSLYLKPAGFYGTRPLEIQLLQDRRVIARPGPTPGALNEGGRVGAGITPQGGGFGGRAGPQGPLRVPPPSGYPPRYSG